MNHNYITLISKIKGLASESKKIRNDRRGATGDRLWRLQSSERALGRDARHHLLAYAFLKNVPHKKVENHCACLPDANKIFKIIDAYRGRYFFTPKQIQINTGAFSRALIKLKIVKPHFETKWEKILYHDHDKLMTSIQAWLEA